MIANTARAKSRTVETVYMRDEFVKTSEKCEIERRRFRRPCRRPS